MPRHHTRTTYARLIGEIAIEWNHLERQMRTIGFGYLRGDPEVGTYVVNSMGNVSITDFVAYLCERFESEQSVKDSVMYLINMFHILRENRNILEHAMPEIDHYFQRYKGKIFKPDKRGLLKPFVAPIKELKDTLASLEQARGYGRAVSLAVYRYEFDHTERVNKEPTMREAIVHVLASLERPPLPRKLSPPPPEGVPPSAQRRPQPSRG
jgi:hypothetical protein